MLERAYPRYHHVGKQNDPVVVVVVLTQCLHSRIENVYQSLPRSQASSPKLVDSLNIVLLPVYHCVLHLYCGCCCCVDVVFVQLCSECVSVIASLPSLESQARRLS